MILELNSIDPFFKIDPKLTTVKLVESDGIIGGGDVEVWLSLCCDEDLASCHAHTQPQKLSLRAGSKFYHALTRIQPVFTGVHWKALESKI